MCCVYVYLILRQYDEIFVNYFVGKKMDVEKKKRIDSEMTMSGLFLHLLHVQVDDSIVSQKVDFCLIA